jgi:hypothetical protein
MKICTIARSKSNRTRNAGGSSRRMKKKRKKGKVLRGKQIIEQSHIWTNVKR